MCRVCYVTRRINKFKPSPDRQLLHVELTNLNHLLTVNYSQLLCNLSSNQQKKKMRIRTAILFTDQIVTHINNLICC